MSSAIGLAEEQAFELVDIFDVAVDRSEADAGDGVDVLQAIRFIEGNL